MNESKYAGKTLNLFELLNEQTIQIPIIQRDYAQGREDKKEIRENFLNALLECVTLEDPIKLDFVYGSLVDERFQPLDGQQRLTTLFLLHWYSATKENRITESSIRSAMLRFSYETRISSREFCTALVEDSIQITGVDQKISDLIIDANWFFLSWKSDPTIDAMLRTLNDIHERFYSVEDLWSKLTSSLIQFYFVELENMGLTDDLYIKMNARGKLLTPFENFKAGFQKKIDDENWELNTELTKTFGVKIDNDWADFFWESFRKNNSIDDAVIRLISAIAMIIPSVERGKSADERIDLITQLQEEPASVRPNNFTLKKYNYLVSYFNIYNEQAILKDYLTAKFSFPMWRHSPKASVLSMIVFDENTFSTLQRNSATYSQKVLFFAQAEFFRRNDEYEEENYQDWMRVIRNIISRADIDKDGSRPDIIRSPQSFDGVINLINELANGCSNIYEHLSHSPALKSQFAKDQIAEEIAKAQLIIKYPDLKHIIFTAEDNELLRGKITFIFHVIGYDYSVENFDVDLFSKVSEVLNLYFNSEDSLNNDIRRAMLTIDLDGTYEFYTYWWSYWHVGNAVKRRLFDRFREVEYFVNDEYYREYFKKFVLLLIDKTPIEISAEFQANPDFPNWKKRLIKEHSILDSESNTNFIAIAEDNSYCYLLKSLRPRDLEGNIKIE
ncbi:MAG: DUF262 domain-containing protein [Bacteroidota bacterium]